MPLTLKDVLPQDFFGGEFTDSAAVKHLDCVVVSSHKRGGWQGKHKHIMCWWKLSNGYAVGWNENPSAGWSFPVIKMADPLLNMTTKKKETSLAQGSELVGFVVKRNDSYQVIADGRASNLSKADFRALMQYPD